MRWPITHASKSAGSYKERQESHQWRLNVSPNTTRHLLCHLHPSQILSPWKLVWKAHIIIAHEPSTQLIIHHISFSYLSDRLLSNMFKFASALAIVVATTIPSTSAFFSTKITTPVKREVSSLILSYQNEPGMQSPVTFQPPDAAFDIAGTYERAIDCANNYGLCAIDELIDLSEGTNIVVWHIIKYESIILWYTIDAILCWSYEYLPTKPSACIHLYCHTLLYHRARWISWLFYRRWPRGMWKWN